MKKYLPEVLVILSVLTGLISTAIIWPEMWMIALLVAAIVAVVAGTILLLSMVRTGCFIDYIVISNILEVAFKIIGILVLAIIKIASGSSKE